MAADLPIWKRPRARVVALALVMWALVAALGLLAVPVLLPFILSALAAYVIDPVIVRLSRIRLRGRDLPRWAAVLAVYVVLGLTIWLLAVSVVPQV